jgi:DNA-binding transcriptional ArsR family regulator
MATLGPIAEAVFAVGMMARGGSPLFGPWQQRLADQLGPQGPNIMLMAKTLRPVRDLLWVIERSGAEPGDRIPGTEIGRREALAAVQELGQRSIMPYWRRITSYLEGERDARGRILMSSGVEGLLNTLHPRIRWNSPVLEIASAEDSDIYLDGTGLLLAPALFLFRHPAVMVNATPATDRPVLVFSAPPDLDAAAGLWGNRVNIGEPLAPLVGRTRAKLLRKTKVSCTTGELAAQLGISPACVSQHTGVLRQAGLITTRRNRNTVVHSITSLGMALLGDRLRQGPSMLVGRLD